MWSEYNKFKTLLVKFCPPNALTAYGLVVSKFDTIDFALYLGLVPLNKKLKLHYPNCKNILCIRHPLDILVKSSHNYERYGNCSSWSPSLLEKINHLNKWYSDEIVESSDVIIRMEDMVFDTVNTLKNLISKLNIVCDDKIIEDFCKEIKASNTIGKGSDILKTASKNEQFEINKLMKKFNYGN